MSTKYLEANSATGSFAGRNAVYAGSESGDSDEEHNNRPYYDDEKNIRPLEAADTSASMKSISHTDHSHHKFYKPFSNRTAVLSVFLLVIGACILLMELAISTHPRSDEVTRVLRRNVESDVSEESFVQASYPLSHDLRKALEQRDSDGEDFVKRSSDTMLDTSETTFVLTFPVEPITSTIMNIPVTQERQDTSKSTLQQQPETTSVLTTQESIETSKSTTTNPPDPVVISSTKQSQEIDTPIQIISDTENTSATSLSASDSTTKSAPVVIAPPPSKLLVTNTPTESSKSSQEDHAINAGKSPKRQETSPEPLAVTSAEIHVLTLTSKPIVTSEPVISSNLPVTQPTSNGISTADDGSSAPVTTAKPGQPPPNSQLVTDKPDTTSQGLTGAPNPNNLIVTDKPDTTSQGGTVAPNPNNLLVTSTTLPMPGQPPPNSQLVTNNPSSSQRQTTLPPTVVPLPNPLDQLVTTSSPPTVYQPNPNSNMVTGSENQISNKGPSTSLPVSAASPAPNSQLVTTNPNSGINTMAVSVTNKVTTVVTGSNGAVSTITSAVVAVLGATPQASVVSGSIIVSGTSVIGTISGQAQSGSVSTGRAGLFTLTDSRGQATATVSFTGAVILTNSNGQATATISYTAPQTTGTSDKSSTTPQKDVAWNKYSYFFAKYLPNIVAVILQATWLIIFATFKMMEPFYQLASPRGASAESSLTADYLSAGLSLSFLKAALDGHWVMLLAGFIQLFLALTVSLSSDAFNVYPTAFCTTAIGTQPCAPKWVVNMEVARTLEVLLVGCFSMVLMIIVLNIRRVSGVYTDPSKIATMADILVHKPFIQELRDIPPSASQAEMELDLKDNRYMLGTFAVNGRVQYGIIKLNVLPQSFTKEPYMSRLGRRFDFWWERTVEDFQKKLPYASDFLCIIFGLTLWCIVLAYYLIPGEDESNALNAFMSNDQKFGASFILSMIAVSMGFLLKHKERDYRLSHPYVVMSKGPQAADQCITTGLRSTQYSALPKSIHSKDTTLALLSMAAILSDMNLLLVPGIPWTAAQMVEVYRASTYGCLTVVAIIIIIHVRVTFMQWRRGHHAENPGTLVGVLMRLCGSRFVEEKNNQAVYGPISRLEFWQDDDERQRTRYGGPDKERKYRYGCMEGVDGVQRYMVEEDFWSQKQPSSRPLRAQVKYA